MKISVSKVDIYRKEIESLIKEFPKNIVVILFLVSLALFPLLKENHETMKAICEGIISGFVFYLFIETLPSATKKINKLNRFAKETGQIESYFQHLLSIIKTELSQAGQTVPVEDQFFKCLQYLNISYMPQTNNLKRISSTVQTPTGIQFNYSNLGGVLDSELHQIKKRIIRYDKIADIYGIDELDAEIAEIVRNLEDKTLNPRGMIAQVGHVGNNAALYGTELDLLRDEVKKIQTQLKENWFTEIHF
jgi:hypothetical protein